VVIVFAYLFFMTMTSLYYTSFLDAGIVPRNLDAEDGGGGRARDQPRAQLTQRPGMPANADMLSTGDVEVCPDKTIMVNGLPVVLKYCTTCRIYRPPRCSHCRICDNCVEIHDHHCIWVNNCIGRRNYRSFLIFLASLVLLCTYIVAFSVGKIVVDATTGTHHSVRAALKEDPIPAVLVLFCAIFGTGLGLFAGFHCWLMSKNRTTHEHIRATAERSLGFAERGRNPYDQGNCLKNCVAVICRPQYPSMGGIRMDRLEGV